MAQDILEGLNPRQREAVEAVEGPLLIVAGPGSGKTRVIVHRVAYLVKVCGVSPYRICAVTFTNKAAREMRERLLRLLGPRAEDLTAGTFHATCAGILRREGQHIGLDRGFAIYDDEDQLTLMKRALEELNLDPKRYNPRAVHGAISRAKAQLVGPEEFGKQAAGYFEEVVHRVYAAYQALLQQSQAVDFDDLLMQTYRLFRDCPQVLEKYQSRYVHLLIDEFQDTNVAQYALARQLAGSHRNICVVGDPDQSIYSWRHADIRNILSFQRDFPDARVVALDENYRSTQVILEAAQRVIAANQQRLEKHLFTRKERGAPVVVVEAYDEDEEARWVLQEADRLHKEGRRYGDCAVMYRVNAQSRALEEGCLRYGVPYRVVGALRFYQRREVKDVIAYLRLALNLHDEVSFARVANVPPRGIGQRTLDELVRWARAQGVTTYAALESLAKNEANAPLPSAGQRALLRFYALLGNLATASQEKTVVALLDYALERTGYRAWLEEAGEEGQERWENLLELRGIAREFDSLEPREGLVALLERVALVSDVDNLEAGKDALTLITLHQAKGLEFPVVFMVGM
ncbi:MAG: UvrD-helicase domain-containing protein, partial [Chloroflexi bacterium]|nr:UvrD-helicase domain-containing protein [Chloroflexota bacterium]